MNRLYPLSAAIVVASLAVAGTVVAVTNRPQPARHHVIGTLGARQCAGAVALGNAPVTVRDGDGHLIASTTTDAPFFSTDSCLTGFRLDLPDTAVYQVQVGTHGGLSYTHEELAAKHWDMVLTLGPGTSPATLPLIETPLTYPPAASATN